MQYPTQTPPRKRPWMKIALGLSLALNLAVAGLMVGGALREHRGGARPDMVRELNFGPFTKALSEEDRRALRADFFAKAPEFRQTRALMRGDMQAILAALRADPFDPVALRSAIANQNARIGRQIQLGQDLIVVRIEAMTPQARAAFADRLEDDRLRRRDSLAGKDRGRKD